MSDKPGYYEDIRKRAADRWVQLNNDPDLAGPWHQLFKQVQNPRHLVSELLQNADDAGATEATVDVLNGEFVFTHDGEDFSAEHFGSLCRFGYSNKRALHTIGFRGIGFKSTFSLGDEVRLLTPTLAVKFHRDRFTEPVWLESSQTPARTEVRVTIEDDNRIRDLERNLKEWLESPSALLFFRSIRCLRIGETEVRWISCDKGPVPESEWMALHSSPEEKYLLIRSPAEEFPDDALEEIRQERMVSLDESTSFPPCPMDIVLGLEGRLYVILPTGVTTDLPFACNAPFIQDPARVEIKDPDISPTNRWLLSRAGKLAATAMLAWLADDDKPLEERCGAYNLFSAVDRDDYTLAGSCAEITEQAFDEHIQQEEFLLSEAGRLVPRNGCIDVPTQLIDIWTPEQISAFFIEDEQPILSHHIPSNNRNRLVNRGCVQRVYKRNVVEVLESNNLPKPASWRQLMELWSYLSDDVQRTFYRNNTDVKIVPVQSKDVLYATEEVVRLGEKKLLHSEEDWEFLSDKLLVLNQNWPRYLAEQRRKAGEHNDEILGTKVENAFRVLSALELTEASDVSRVIQQVADEFFVEDDCDIADCIRLAQIAASLGASVTDSFQYVTCDNRRTAISSGIVVDVHDDLDTFVDSEWYEYHVLHKDYRTILSCTNEEWKQWIVSDRSKLLTFLPYCQTQKRVLGRSRIRDSVKEKGLSYDPYCPFVTDTFIIEDWDYNEEYWKYWHTIAHEDETIWGRLLTRIFDQPERYWAKASSARALQISTTGSRKAITTDPLLPSWIIKFRGLPCLQDTYGKYRQPAELLRRTPETESLLDIEPFVRAELDTEATRQLLIMLGVRDTPTGIGKLLDRMRALATLDNPLSQLREITKWYGALDRVLPRCSTEEQMAARIAFSKERLILTNDCEWVSIGEVFQEPDEVGLPGTPVIHSSVGHLSLWSNIGVAMRPTAEGIIKWLINQDSEAKFDAPTARRVKSVLSRYPTQVWEECEHWITLDSTWVPVEQLDFRLTMRGLTKWKDLHPKIKQQTADFLMLSADTCDQPPFSSLSDLGASVEFRITEKQQSLPTAEKRPWFQILGQGLERVPSADEDQQATICEAARRLTQTVWQPFQNIRVTPYIDGTPAGQPHSPDVLWNDRVLFVRDGKLAKIFGRIASELARPFTHIGITEAIKACIERSPEFIEEYLEENFELADTPLVVYASDNQPNDSATPEPSLDGQATPEAESGGSESTDHPDDHTAELQVTPDGSISDPTENSQEIGSSIVPVDSRPEPQTPIRERRIDTTLIRRFTELKEYQWSAIEKRYTRKDGTWIEKAELPFNWQRFSQTGKLIRRYWVVEQCLSGGGIEITAELWELIRKYPDSTALITLHEDGSPLEISGDELVRMQEGGAITLYPAKYRIRKTAEVGA